MYRTPPFGSPDCTASAQSHEQGLAGRAAEASTQEQAPDQRRAGVITTTVVEQEGRPGHVDVVIRLLGEAEATVGGQVVPVLAAQRMTRLLARLTLARGAWVSRDQLARELWPDSAAAQARTNLRKLLHNLRRSMPGPPDVVDVGGALVRWNAGPAVWSPA